MSRRKKPIQEGRRPSTGASSRIYSRENVGRYSERARQRRRGRMVKRGVLGGLLAVLLVGVVGVGAWFVRVTGNLSGNGVLGEGIRMILNDSDVAREPFYILLLGTDGRPGEDTYRSDSIILARVDPTEKQATLISIPRDTMVVYNGETMKINATHSVDGRSVVKAVNQLCFGGEQKISHYAEINFEGMEQLIDAVGGIDLTRPRRSMIPSISISRSKRDISIWTAPRHSPTRAAAIPMPMAITRACATSARCSLPLLRRFSTSSMQRR